MAGPALSDPVFVSSDGLRLIAVEKDAGIELSGVFRTVTLRLGGATMVVHDHVDRFLLSADCQVKGDPLHGDGRLLVLQHGFILRLNQGRELVFDAQELPWSGYSKCQSH
ncbi:MAG: hypothetical protein MUE52_13805 [Tabrizicola sp.]|nr:hypothetical protein [Tabrizicola sp.]